MMMLSVSVDLQMGVDPPGYVPPAVFDHPLAVAALVFLCLCLLVAGGALVVRLRFVCRGEKTPGVLTGALGVGACLAAAAFSLFLLQALYDIGNGCCSVEWFFLILAEDGQRFGGFALWLCIPFVSVVLFGGGRMLVRRLCRIPDHAFLRLPFDGCMAVTTAVVLLVVHAAVGVSATVAAWGTALGVSAVVFPIVWLLRWKTTNVRDGFAYLAAGIAYGSLAPFWGTLSSALAGVYWANVLCGILLVVCTAALMIAYIFTGYRYLVYRRALKEVALLVQDKAYAADTPELESIVADMPHHFGNVVRIYEYKAAETAVAGVLSVRKYQNISA